MVQSRHRNNPKTLTRYTRMLVAPLRDWSVFQQIFADHWDAFQHAHPRYQTPYYNGLVGKMLDCGNPAKMGYMEYRCLQCGQGKHLVSMSCKSSLCLRCAKVYVDNWVSQVSQVLHEGVIYRHIILTVPAMFKCFDRIDHAALLAKTKTLPVIRRQLKAWLKAGILKDGHLSPTTTGTPQGGSISPLLALIALHGMDEAITQIYPQARVIAYADDGVVLHKDRQILEHCQQLLSTWLAEMGLTLNEAKSRICHTLEGDQPGLEIFTFHRI